MIYFCRLLCCITWAVNHFKALAYFASVFTYKEFQANLHRFRRNAEFFWELSTIIVAVNILFNVGIAQQSFTFCLLLLQNNTHPINKSKVTNLPLIAKQIFTNCWLPINFLTYCCIWCGLKCCWILPKVKISLRVHINGYFQNRPIKYVWNLSPKEKVIRNRTLECKQMHAIVVCNLLIQL